MQAGDLVLGAAGLADPGDGLLRVVRAAVALLAGTTTATATAGAVALALVSSSLARRRRRGSGPARRRCAGPGCRDRGRSRPGCRPGVVARRRRRESSSESSESSESSSSSSGPLPAAAAAAATTTAAATAAAAVAALLVVGVVGVGVGVVRSSSSSAGRCRGRRCLVGPGLRTGAGVLDGCSVGASSVPAGGSRGSGSGTGWAVFATGACSSPCRRRSAVPVSSVVSGASVVGGVAGVVGRRRPTWRGAARRGRGDRVGRLEQRRGGGGGGGRVVGPGVGASSSGGRRVARALGPRQLVGRLLDRLDGRGGRVRDGGLLARGPLGRGPLRGGLLGRGALGGGLLGGLLGRCAVLLGGLTGADRLGGSHLGGGRRSDGWASGWASGSASCASAGASAACGRRHGLLDRTLAGDLLGDRLGRLPRRRPAGPVPRWPGWCCRCRRACALLGARDADESASARELCQSPGRTSRPGVKPADGARHGAGAPCRATATSSGSFVERAAHRHCPRSPTSYEELLSPTPHAVSRLSANGSPTVPSCVSRGPWASRSCNGADIGLEPHQGAESGEDVVGSHGRGSVSQNHLEYRTLALGSRSRRGVSDTTAARQSKVRSPFLVIRSTSTSSAARNAATPCAACSRGHGRDRRTPDAGLEQVREGPARGLHDLQDVEPGGQRLVERGEHLGGVGDLARRPISRYSASLAAPVGEAPA